MANSITDALKVLWVKVKDLFSLHFDTDEYGTIENVKKSIEFRGGNLWGLIFACLIASIGLNTNSTAVVIGAMLISPLMGPIVGVGFSVGTNDFDTLKYSLRNLLLMIVLSIGAAALYFLLSPLKEATPELLARTRPSLYDVLIAIFGGIIGIVASSRKDRGNAIPGVAIATALMPPLCTAGYGLATLQGKFLIGAFYLFIINSIFIALTTMIVVRSLQFPQKEFLDKKQEKRVRLLIYSIVVLTIIPSAITAWSVVNEAIFKSRVKEYMDKNFNYEYSWVTNHKADYYGRDSSVIDITMGGKELSDEQIVLLKGRLPKFGLKRTTLKIHQYRDKPIINNTNNLDIAKYDEIYRQKLEALESKDKQIELLKEQILQMKNNKAPIYKKPLDEVAQKIAALYPEIKEMGFSEVIKTTIVNDSAKIDTIPTAIVKWKKGNMPNEYRKRILRYLKMEIKLDTVEVVNY